MATYTYLNLDQWSDRIWQRADDVIGNALGNVITQSQTPKSKGGRMPVLDGFLRKSLQSSLNGQGGLTGAASHIAVTSAMKATDNAAFGWTMGYAMRQNYGFTGTDSAGRTYNQEGNHFLEYGTEQWQRYVNQQAERARGMA